MFMFHPNVRSTELYSKFIGIHLLKSFNDFNRCMCSKATRLSLPNLNPDSCQIKQRNNSSKYNSFSRTYSQLFHSRVASPSSPTYQVNRYCSNTASPNEKKIKMKNGPGLEYFITNSVGSLPTAGKLYSKRELESLSHPYVEVEDVQGHGRKVFFEVYGCQMNVSDTEVVWSVLKEHGYSKTDDLYDAHVILIMTCSIREGAEQKIWKKLDHLKGIKRHRWERKKEPLKIGVLGCMAERLKKKLVEKEKCIDVVAGPDSYRDLPRLLSLVGEGESAVNVLLSLEETYADVVPVSLSTNRMSSFVSIMRGCDNMCTYCIVPFTRGRERSRNIESIVEEVRYLSDQGVKEVTLLGQNVNSYRDTSATQHLVGLPENEITHNAKGFKTIYKPKKGGLRFADLLEKVSNVDPEMRIRFTSPHPKDFPDEVLYLIKERDNICNHLHMPAQSGNNRILDLMRRGYTREAYIELVSHVRSIIPDVSLTSDFISGFCSETEVEFEETISLIELIKYNFCFVFPYSMREKTPAHRRFEDNVPDHVKRIRSRTMVDTFRKHAEVLNRKQIGEQQLVLVEGKSKRSDLHLAARNDGNTKVIFPNTEIVERDVTKRKAKPGDYVLVLITEGNSQVLKGTPLKLSSIQEFSCTLHRLSKDVTEVPAVEMSH